MAPCVVHAYIGVGDVLAWKLGKKEKKKKITIPAFAVWTDAAIVTINSISSTLVFPLKACLHPLEGMPVCLQSKRTACSCASPERAWLSACGYIASNGEPLLDLGLVSPYD